MKKSAKVLIVLVVILSGVGMMLMVLGQPVQFGGMMLAFIAALLGSMYVEYAEGSEDRKK